MATETSFQRALQLPRSLPRAVLLLDGVFLALVGSVAMIQEALGHFAARGPLAYLFQSPYTIGGFEAHGLAVILGALLVKQSADANAKLWHGVGLAIHLLLGASNMAFWPSFVTLGLLPIGIATTVIHAGFVVAHFFCFRRYGHATHRLASSALP